MRLRSTTDGATACTCTRVTQVPMAAGCLPLYPCILPSRRVKRHGASTPVLSCAAMPRQFPAAAAILRCVWGVAVDLKVRLMKKDKK